MNIGTHITTLGQLKEAGYTSKSIKEELRNNLIIKLQQKQNPFSGIWGYEDTVRPDLERALLAGHNINLLGLRGQAKTKIARLITSLLDEYIPIISGSDLNDDPFAPISNYGIGVVKKQGDKTPIAWLHRDERYTEKLATPDVSIADLIGDVDPIKAAALKLPYSDERVIHFGLIPRANRGVFTINELPDLQARIQVALFNILQESDIQIRGFKLLLSLDIQFVFTANPEDYTNRGNIVTPLKDRIDSQIITHYPNSIQMGKKITRQEARIKPEQKDTIEAMELVRDLVEQIAFEARKSELVDAKSGVSARLTISAFEHLTATAERRIILNKESDTFIRLIDFTNITPSITGKIELVYEGEQEGIGMVAQNLVGKAIRNQFINYFPDPDTFRKQKEKNPYKKIIEWFGKGNTVDLLCDMSDIEYQKALNRVVGLKEVVRQFHASEKGNNKVLLMELALYGLAEYSQINKRQLVKGFQFKDLISGIFNMSNEKESNDANTTFQ